MKTTFSISSRPGGNVARLILTALASVSFGLCVAPSFAQTTTKNFPFTPNLLIPDNSSVGVADSETISTSLTGITDITLTLNVTGGFNGDFYAYLSHNTAGGNGFAVLLNRAGRTAANTFGYADSGFSSVTFNDATGGSLSGDIHTYENSVNPNGGALSGGTWQSDGRNVNPTLALDTTARSAFLTSFNTLDPNGTWTLYIADLSPGGIGTFTSWNLSITGVVPEVGTTGLLGVTALLLACGFRGQTGRKRHGLVAPLTQ